MKTWGRRDPQREQQVQRPWARGQLECQTLAKCAGDWREVHQRRRGRGVAGKCCWLVWTFDQVQPEARGLLAARERMWLVIFSDSLVTEREEKE